MSKLPFTVNKRGTVPIIEWPGSLRVGGSVRVLLQFDEHWDNPKSDQDLIKTHMQEAVDGGIPIIKGGDTFCAMQGRYDPRRARTDVRKEHDFPDYVDRLVSGYAEFAEFAAPNIAFMGRGNHELGVLKNIETDLIERTAERLRIKGSPVITGGIGGWLLFRVHVTKTTKVILPVFYHHGHGGGGPVTKGVIQTNRRSTYLPDASVIISGHVHEEWTVTLARDRMNPATGRQWQDEQLHICTATYKDEYAPEKSTWHSLNGRPPKPIGATWLDLTLMKHFDERTSIEGEGSRKTPHYRLHPSAVRAK